jgi:hypothetical protein
MVAAVSGVCGRQLGKAWGGSPQATQGRGYNTDGDRERALRQTTACTPSTTVTLPRLVLQFQPPAALNQSHFPYAQRPVNSDRYCEQGAGDLLCNVTDPHPCLLRPDHARQAALAVAHVPD